MDKLYILENVTIIGNIVRLPDIQLDRKLYKEVANSLELIGGKWNTKQKGFVFKDDPTDLIDSICVENNLKKDYQFFATPSELADRLVILADIKDNNTVLEPSAGQGAIIKSINRLTNITPDCYEIMDTNRIMLNKSGLMFNLIGDDFLKHTNKKYDRIVANPPFTKNQDIKHLKKMYECLNENGILVCITSNSWVIGSTKIQTEFKEWLNTKHHGLIEIEEGAFKESGTKVKSNIVIIKKVGIN